MTNTNIPLTLPAFNERIGIVFSSDDTFVPYLGVCLFSLIKNSSSTHNYDIIILHENITQDHQDFLSCLATSSNISIRFVNISSINKNKSFFLREHFTKATYYRLYIPSLFSEYKQIIYYDCDGVFNTDIAELYDIPFGDFWLAAAHDPEIVRCSFHSTWWKTYKDTVLCLEKPLDYFQAGCLIYNMPKILEVDFESKAWEVFKRIPNPNFVDQDILSVAAHGHVLFLDLEWNVEWHIPLYQPRFKEQIPADLCNDYINARKNPKFIHYCSSKKAWNNPQAPLAHYFWEYARQTPFYEEILFRNFPKPFIKLPPDTTVLIKKVANRHKTLFKYYRCKVLATVTWGKRRQHYQQKRDSLHQQVRQIREFLKK